MVKRKPKKRTSVSRLHNAGTMSDAEKHAMIINALRKLSSWWKPLTRTKAAARVWVWLYKCEKCWEVGKEFSPPPKGKKRRIKNFAVDHKREIVPVIGFDGYDSWIERCFIEKGDWLWVLCKICHDLKSKTENEERRLIRKWEEVWRESQYEWYFVSNIWRVKWIKGTVLSQTENWWWYMKISIWRAKKEYVHRIVAFAFIWEVEGLQVCHKDDDPKNNNAKNLFIWTVQDNMDDKVNKWRHIIWWKPIIQYSMELEFIKNWEWWAWEIQRELWYSDSNIYNCCYWKYKQAYWYIWNFKTK